MINNVILVGRLTKDPDLRYTRSEAAASQFTLAINRDFTNTNNEKEVDFISCVIWRRAVELLASYAIKGTLIGLAGRIQARNYKSQQGRRIYVAEVITESFRLLESREINEQQKERATGKAAFDKQSMDKPSPLDPFSPENSIVGISDNDLPF